MNISSHYQSLSYLIGILNICDQWIKNLSQTFLEKDPSVSDTENMVTLAKMHPAGCGLCISDVNTGKLQKPTHLWVSQEGVLQCEDFLVTVTWLYAFFMSIQQSHSILMTWVCCLLFSFNFWFLCLSGSASPLTIWGYLPSQACFSV